MHRAKSILDEAQKIVEGSRQQEYGTPENSFSTIGKYWSAYLGREVSAQDVAMMMVLFKVARESNQHKRDNLVDIAGYTACAATLHPE